MRAPLLLALLALLFCLRPLASDQVYYYGDISRHHFALHTAMAGQARAGHWPLWTDQLYAGLPMHAEGQAGLYYPPNLLYYLPGLPLTVALKLSICLHFFLAGFFTWLLARRLGLDPGPAFLAAVTFAFSGYLVTRVIHQNVLHAAVWLPLQLYVLATAAQEQTPLRRLGFLLLAGLSVAVQALAFHPQITFYSLLALGAWCLFGPAVQSNSNSNSEAGSPKSGSSSSSSSSSSSTAEHRTPDTERHPLPHRLLAFAFVAGVGLLLAAAQLLPTLELLRHSPRGEGRDYHYLTEMSLPLKHLPTLLLPNLYGSPASDDYWGAPNHWELCGYVGALPLLLALPALAARRSRRGALFFAGLAAAALLMSLGAANPIYHLLPYVPGFNLFKAPARYLFLVGFGLAMLAGYGLQALLEGPGSAGTARVRPLFSRGALLVGVGSGLLALAGGVGRPWLTRLAEARVLPRLLGSEGRTRPPAYYVEQFQLKWDAYLTARLADLCFLALLGVLCALLIAWLGRRERGETSAGWLRVGLVLLSLIDLFRFGVSYNPLIDPSYYTSPPLLARAIAADAARRGGGPRAYRAWRVGTEAWEREVRAGHSGWAGSTAFEFQLREALPWNLNLFDPHGLRLLDGGAALPPGRSQEFADWAEAALRQPGAPEARRAVAALGAVNVRYLVSPLDLRPAGARPLTSAAGLTLYTLDNSLPGAFLAAGAAAPGPAGALESFLSLAPEAPRRVMVESAGLPLLDPLPLQPGEEARELDNGLQNGSRVEVEVNAVVPRLLVLLDRTYPGWKCEVDGRPAPLVPAGYLGRGVVVPPGRHRVVFAYRPASARAGLAVSLVALGLVLGACLWALRRHS